MGSKGMCTKVIFPPGHTGRGTSTEQNLPLCELSLDGFPSLGCCLGSLTFCVCCYKDIDLSFHQGIRTLFHAYGNCSVSCKSIVKIFTNQSDREGGKIYHLLVQMLETAGAGLGPSQRPGTPSRSSMEVAEAQAHEPPPASSQDAHHRILD